MLRPTTECITSKKNITTNGYSRLRFGKKHIQAHRWVWELIHGPIPEGFVIDHLCRNRPCVAIDHLRMVTQSENVLAGLHSVDNRSHCNQGHPFTKENIKIGRAHV